MRNRSLLLLSLLLVVVATSGQSISRQEADSMVKVLPKSRGMERIDLLLTLAQFHIFKPGELAIDFDSATTYINEAAALNKSVKSPTADGYRLLTESYMAKEKGQAAGAKKMVEQAILILKSGSNKSYLGQAYFELSMHYSYGDSLQRAQRIALVEQSIGAFQQAGDLRRKAYSLKMLGDLYSMMDDLPGAVKVLKEAVAVYDSIHYPHMQGVYVLLGECYMYMREHSQGLFYLLKALKAAQIDRDTSMQLCQINNILGNLYQQIDRKELAAKYLNDALDVARKWNDEFSIFLVATNIALTYNELGRPHEALKALSYIDKSRLESDQASNKYFMGQAYLRTYMVMNEFSKAQPFCDTVLRLADDRRIGEQSRNMVYRLAATYFIARRQYEKARRCLLKNVDVDNKPGNEIFRIKDAILWYQVDSAQGDFRSAFAHLHYYKATMDSIFSETRVRQQQVLSVEYETAMKEDSIRLKDKDIALLTQQNKLHQADLKQASLIRNVTIVGIIGAFVIIGMLYRQYRQKQKSNEEISRKNEQLQHYLEEKEWLLKEVHHRVKNNLQIVMSLLNSQSVYLDNGPALAAIHDSQHRVHAMSLIHQKLYSSDNVSAIDMSVYIRELVSYLADSFDTAPHIRFVLDVECVEMDVSQAIPLGLILNEAITNAIKYAFPDGRNGVITISLSASAVHGCLLRIADSGVGIPASLDMKNGSLGMSLMAGLSKDLGGDFSIENDQGTVINISFVHAPGLVKQGGMAGAFVSDN